MAETNINICYKPFQIHAEMLKPEDKRFGKLAKTAETKGEWVKFFMNTGKRIIRFEGNTVDFNSMVENKFFDLQFDRDQAGATNG